MITVTTSWDDGDARDSRVADLLDKHGIRGTFYITRDQPNRLSEEAIRDLASWHEVGAHTLTHADLPTLSRDEKRYEIGESKAWLERVTGKDVDMFCYPYGRYDAETKEMVQEAGFIGARSSDKTLGTIPVDPFALPVTMMTYRAPYGIAEKFLLRIPGIRVSNLEWLTRAHAKLEKIAADGGIFHLWGHSWEIDQFQLWDSLDQLLGDIAAHDDVRSLTNGELVRGYRDHNL